jgi:hypothetical protein
MLGSLLSDRVIVQLVPFLVGCLIIGLVCFLFSGLCALLCDHLAAYVVGGFLVVSCFLLLAGTKWSLPNLSVEIYNISSVYSVFLLVYVCMPLFVYK